MKSKDYSYDALEKLLGMIFEDGKCLAHFAHGPFCGITNRALSCPQCVEYINQFLVRVLPKGMTWSTFAITCQLRATTHTDVRNLEGSNNCAFSLGQSKGGGLCAEDQGGDRNITNKQGKNFKAKLRDTCRKPICSPKSAHAVQAWTGVRLSVACYATRSVFDLKPEETKTLQSNLSSCRNRAKPHVAFCLPLARRGVSPLSRAAGYRSQVVFQSCPWSCP